MLEDLAGHEGVVGPVGDGIAGRHVSREHPVPRRHRHVAKARRGLDAGRVDAEPAEYPEVVAVATPDLDEAPAGEAEAADEGLRLALLKGAHLREWLTVAVQYRWTCLTDRLLPNPRTMRLPASRRAPRSIID